MAATDHATEREITLFHIERGKLLIEMQRTRCAQQKERGYESRESQKLLRELEAGLHNFEAHLRFLTREQGLPG